MKRARGDDDALVRRVRTRPSAPTSCCWLVALLPPEMRCLVRSLLRRRDRICLSLACRTLYVEDVGPHWPPNVVAPKRQTALIVRQFWRWMEMLDEAGIVDWPEFARLELRTWSDGFQRNFMWLPPRCDIRHSYHALSAWCGDRYAQPEFMVTMYSAPLDMGFKCQPTPSTVGKWREWLLCSESKTKL